MKKKIMVVATVMVIALVAAYGFYNNQNKNALADLMLDNVEALAQSETVGPWYCVGVYGLCYVEGTHVISGLRM